jgi:hypothetical protein
MADRSCLFHAVKCESTFKGHVKGSARTKTTIITKQLFDVLHKVEKLLISDLTEISSYKMVVGTHFLRN